MAYPFTQWPTLREFIEVATAQGCKEITIEGLVGPKGPAPGRCLIGPNNFPYPLPGIPDHERLGPTVIASVERALGIKTGFLPPDYDHEAMPY